MTTAATWNCPDWKLRLGWMAGLVLVLCILFAGFLSDLVSRWAVEPQYSHGFVIPFMAVGLAWFRRDKLTPGTARSHAGGLLLIVIGVILHINARYFYLEPADGAGLLCCIAGIILLVWGSRLTLAVWPAILFLSVLGHQLLHPKPTQPHLTPLHFDSLRLKNQHDQAYQ